MKNQGSKYFGRHMIVFGAISLAFSLFYFAISFKETMNEINSISEDSYKRLGWFTGPLIVVIPFFVGGIIMLIIGILRLNKYTNVSKIKETGVPSVAKVLSFDKSRRGGRRGIVYYFMIAEYKGESGQVYNLNVAVPFKIVQLCKPGMLIRCYVQGEQAYIDVDNIVELVKKEN